MPLHLSYRHLRPHRIAANNPNHAWLEKNYSGFLHTIFMQGIHAGIFLMNKYFPFGFKTGYSINTTSRDGQSMIDWFWDARELDRVRRLFMIQGKKNLTFFNRYYRWWETRSQAAMAALVRAERLDFTAMSDRRLYDEYERLYWSNIMQGAGGYVADCFLATGEQDWLTEFVRSRLPDRFDLIETMSVLTAPVIPSYSQAEETALARIVSRVSKKFTTQKSWLDYAHRHKTLWSAIERHTARFYWAENNYYAKILTPDYFARKLYRFVHRNETNDARMSVAVNRRNKDRLLRKIGDPWLTNVIRMSEQMTHVQDTRKQHLIRCSHFLELIFREMARRTGLTVVDFRNLVEPEIAGVFLDRKIDRRLLRARRQKNFTAGTPQGYIVYAGTEEKKYLDDSQFHQSYTGVTMIKGVTACAGYARGIVRVIRNAHNAGAFNRGDILVTNQTTPEFIPIMKKAGAVVTEQGGITAHAAIISRELNIPCIIGTKIATKVFKTGDGVEVDATEGIVRKI